MKREPLWRRYLRFWGPAPGSDVDDEFDFHLRSTIDELQATGMSAAEAREEATRRFGPIRPVWKECYMISKKQIEVASRTEYVFGWWRDVVYAARVLRKAKASTAAILVILALGIGASTAVATLLDRLLYRPLPVKDPSQLVRLAESYVSVDKSSTSKAALLTYPGYLHLREESRSFSGILAEASLRVTESRTGEQISVPADAHPVSGNFFDVLGVRALRGRTIQPSDDTPTTDSHVAVASYRFWTRRYDQAADVIGAKVYLRNLPFTIIGVMPPEFAGTIKGSDPDLYVPMSTVADFYGAAVLKGVGFRTFRVMGRLNPEASLSAARSEMDVLWPRFITSTAFASMPGRSRPDPATARIDLSLGAGGYEALQGEGLNSLMLIVALVATIVLIGCVNVACLLIARGVSRRNEIAIRLSLGAGASRILRQSLIESCLLAGAGAAAGMILVVWLQRLILVALKWGDRPLDMAPDGRIIFFSVAMALVTGLVCGFVPAYQLLSGGRMWMNPSPRNERVLASFSGKFLVVMEVALSLVMVAGAAMFLRSFQNIRAIPLGFEARDVAVLRVGTDDTLPNLDGVKRNELMMTESVRLAESLAAIPGFESVTATDSTPFLEGSVSYAIGKADKENTAAQSVSRNSVVVRVDNHYFGTLRIALLKGRTFKAHDDLSSPRVGVIGETLARNLFGEQNPIGQFIQIEDKGELEVIGVVGDIKHRNVKATAPDLLYLSLRQAAPGGAMMTSPKIQIRTRMSPREAAEIVAERIRNGRFPLMVRNESSFENDIGASYLDDRIRMQATSLFGILAMSLTAAGIYGMIAYTVSQRAREISVRMAIGSTPSGIVILVLKGSLKLVGFGVLIGVPAALAVMRILSRFAYQLSPADAASLIGAAAILLFTGIVAAAGPAMRAARLDPIQTLRL